MKFDESEVRRKIRSKIIRYRKEAGKTQEEVAKYVGKNSKTVASWEQGYSLPDLETFLMLARFYNKSVEEMFGLDDE